MPEIKVQPYYLRNYDEDGKTVGVMGYACNVRTFLSQQGEDLEVYVDYFKDRSLENGIYIEAGAVEGWQASNTWYFEHNEDFTGMLVEANPACLTGLRKIRPSNTIVIAALGENDNEMLTLKFPDQNGVNVMWGYIENATTQRQKDTVESLSEGKICTVSVPGARLQTLIERAEFPYVDILFLDVEGSELKALKGLDWSVPIYVIAVELPSGDDTREDEILKNEQCRDILRQQGYIYNKSVGCTELWHLPTFRDGQPALTREWKNHE